MGLKSWYEDHILPRVITCACGQKGIAKRRAALIPLARGKVFEIGCGGGLNQPFYNSDTVTDFAGIEPNGRLLGAAREQAHNRGWGVDIRQAWGEEIPFPGSTFDSVVCTYTLCSVEHPARVVSELRRIMKPDGQLLFLEHGRAPDPAVYAWQRRIEPLWKPLGGGCHLTRPVGGSLRAAGLEVEPLGQGYLARAPRPFGWMEWGIARKHGA